MLTLFRDHPQFFLEAFLHPQDFEAWLAADIERAAPYRAFWQLIEGTEGEKLYRQALMGGTNYQLHYTVEFLGLLQGDLTAITNFLRQHTTVTEHMATRDVQLGRLIKAWETDNLTRRLQNQALEQLFLHNNPVMDFLIELCATYACLPQANGTPGKTPKDSLQNLIALTINALTCPLYPARVDRQLRLAKSLVKNPPPGISLVKTLKILLGGIPDIDPSRGDVLKQIDNFTNTPSHSELIGRPIVDYDKKSYALNTRNLAHFLKTHAHVKDALKGNSEAKKRFQTFCTNVDWWLGRFSREPMLSQEDYKACCKQKTRETSPRAPAASGTA